MTVPDEPTVCPTCAALGMRDLDGSMPMRAWRDAGDHREFTCPNDHIVATQPNLWSHP